MIWAVVSALSLQKGLQDRTHLEGPDRLEQRKETILDQLAGLQSYERERGTNSARGCRLINPRRLTAETHLQRPIGTFA